MLHSPPKAFFKEREANVCDRVMSSQDKKLNSNLRAGASRSGNVGSGWNGSNRYWYVSLWSLEFLLLTTP